MYGTCVLYRQQQFIIIVLRQDPATFPVRVRRDHEKLCRVLVFSESHTWVLAKSLLSIGRAMCTGTLYFHCLPAFAIEEPPNGFNPQLPNHLNTTTLWLDENFFISCSSSGGRFAKSSSFGVSSCHTHNCNIQDEGILRHHPAALHWETQSSKI